MKDLSHASLLQDALDQQAESWSRLADPHKKKVYAEGIRLIIEADILSKAKQIGEVAPDFTLPNASLTPVNLTQYLALGPVVLTWYRGGWCPYCNLALQHLQQALPEIHALGANLIALTPELPDRSLSTIEKNHLDFEVLSDTGNAVARKYGILYKLASEQAEIFQSSFALHQYNGDDSSELPLAASYVIDRQKIIRHAYLHADFRKRAEPAFLISVLRKMAIEDSGLTL